MITLKEAAEKTGIPARQLQASARCGSLVTTRKCKDGGAYLTTEEWLQAFLKAITPEPPEPEFWCLHQSKNWRVNSTAGQLRYCHRCATFRRVQ